MPKEILPIFNSFVKATCQEANPGYFFPRGKYSVCTCRIFLLISLHCSHKKWRSKTWCYRCFAKLKNIENRNVYLLLANLATWKEKLPQRCPYFGCDNLGKCRNNLKPPHSFNSLTTIYLKDKANRNIVTLSFSKNNTE